MRSLKAGFLGAGSALKDAPLHAPLFRLPDSRDADPSKTPAGNSAPSATLLLRGDGFTLPSSFAQAGVFVAPKRVLPQEVLPNRGAEQGPVHACGLTNLLANQPGFSIGPIHFSFETSAIFCETSDSAETVASKPSL